ncbi:hypothetical protein K353_01113 [Kitasatospora sp. SolWspMP-SS2h]|uniref:hypothetical protein n=1 Tax=Kitasatospora sp. SolWspMP-SS2h TaxID=1305729 RepID=UPI000DBA5D60|nr:hypothetical protein [Kitasatospora sp. SolWspMP-SS2h]RAJ45613.1 hypothetical protein K353_01113 [Kitasatospora sp. SolWspMP-SS2h]
MLLLGLLLFAASGAFAGLLIADNLGGGPETGVTVLGHQIATMSTLGAFLAGLALALLFCAGLALMRGGLRWRRHHRAAPVQDTPVALDRTDESGATRADLSSADRPTTTTQRPQGRPRHRFTH